MKFPVYFVNHFVMEHQYTSQAGTNIFGNTIHHSILAATTEDGEDFFVFAKNNMLSVNNWKQYTGSSINVIFELTDKNNHMLHRHARSGDNIRISAPGAAPYLMAHIDSIIYDDYPDTDTESMTMNLFNLNRTDTSSNSLIYESAAKPQTGFSIAIERKGMCITAICNGLQNVFILSVQQLKDLVCGFIDFEEK